MAKFKEWLTNRVEITEVDARNVVTSKATNQSLRAASEIALDMIPGWGILRNVFTAFSAIRGVGDTVSSLGKMNEQFQKISTQLSQQGVPPENVQAVMTALYDVPEELAAIVPPVAWKEAMNSFVSSLGSGTSLESKVFSATLNQVIQNMFGGLGAYGEQMQAVVAENLRVIKEQPTQVKQALQKATAAVTGQRQKIQANSPQEGDAGSYIFNGKRYDGEVAIVRSEGRNIILLLSKTPQPAWLFPSKYNGKNIITWLYQDDVGKPIFDKNNNIWRFPS